LEREFFSLMGSAGIQSIVAVPRSVCHDGHSHSILEVLDGSSLDPEIVFNILAINRDFVFSFEVRARFVGTLNDQFEGDEAKGFRRFVRLKNLSVSGMGSSLSSVYATAWL
jgi:hypothetical protein